MKKYSHFVTVLVGGYWFQHGKLTKTPDVTKSYGTHRGFRTIGKVRSFIRSICTNKDYDDISEVFVLSNYKNGRHTSKYVIEKR